MARKTPGQFWLGVFVCLFASVSASLSFALCQPKGELQTVQLKSVVDGDTLHLTDGRSLRLIGVNTPELAHRNQREEPLARAATAAVTHWLAGQSLLIDIGEKPLDHYGRTLASVFRSSDRASLAEYLLAEGYGWLVAIPPDIAYVSCLAQAESLAREAGKGVWSGQLFPILEAARLKPGDKGFHRVTGRVSRVADSKKAWWIEVENGLSLRLGHENLQYFPELELQSLAGKRISVAGWLIYRGKPNLGYPAHMMHLQHPAMLEFLEE